MREERRPYRDDSFDLEDDRDCDGGLFVSTPHVSPFVRELLRQLAELRGPLRTWKELDELLEGYAAVEAKRHHLLSSRDSRFRPDDADELAACTRRINSLAALQGIVRHIATCEGDL